MTWLFRVTRIDPKHTFLGQNVIYDVVCFQKETTDPPKVNIKTNIHIDHSIELVLGSYKCAGVQVYVFSCPG